MALPPREITELLLELDGSGREAVDLLFDRLYEELRAIAAARLRSERAGHTLGVTALVNEAYLRLADLDRLTWKNRTQFFAIAARVMRRILVNHARDRQAQKRGGGAELVTLEAGMDGEPGSGSATLSWDDLITADRALEELARRDERQARVLELRLFAGLNHEEVASALDISVPTVRRDWRVARAFLAKALS